MSELISNIKVIVPTEVKEDAEIIFNSLGLDIETAINIFLKMAIAKQEVPFDINAQTSDDNLDFKNVI